MKTCCGCDKRKSIFDFYVDPRNKAKRQARCKLCCRQWARDYVRRDPVATLLMRARRRAREEGMPFGISRVDIEPLPQRCPVLGIGLRLSGYPQDPRAYSLDRLDNTEGYIVGNVAVISYLANRLKNNGTADQHEAVAKWMRSKGLQ